METNFISVHHDRKSDKVLVWERPVSGGKRILKEWDAPRYFYVPDEEGDRLTITGEKVRRVDCVDQGQFDHLCRSFQKKFESDVSSAARVLMDEYFGRKTPIINYGFVDIETDYSSAAGLGFSSPENPYAPINAVTIFKSVDRSYVTFVVPPPGWNRRDGFESRLKDMLLKHDVKIMPDIYICANEKELLAGFLEEIEDLDLISGWNSEFFDIPYIIKRIERVYGERIVARMCFNGAPPPKEGQVVRFGSPRIVYKLFGRIHLDYLDAFKKFTFEGRTSYSLGNIGQEELGIPKLDYEGTLEQLYKGTFEPDVSKLSFDEAFEIEDEVLRLANVRALLKRELKNDPSLQSEFDQIDADFKDASFLKFTAYNLHDVQLLVMLDDKFKFIQLVNQMAHENTVPFEAILGTVRYVETGIMNRAHHVHNLVCFNKEIVEHANEKVEGALVMTPLAGLHDWIASVDINSLYPSVIRALNMSRETVIGQFKEGEDAWRGIIANDSNLWTLEFDDYTPEQKTGAEWNETFKEMNWAISAFGTVFDQGKVGMVADTLTFWFSERKRLQAEKKKWTKEAISLKEKLGVEVDKETLALLKE